MDTMVIKGFYGGGGSIKTLWNPIRAASTSGNDLQSIGFIVLILTSYFVGGCGGKPFHSVGQAEVEEDTTQGSLKEKFPDSLASAMAHASESIGHSGKHPVVADILLGNDEDNDDETNELMGMRALLENENEVWPPPPQEKVYPHYRPEHHFIRHLNPNNDNNAYGLITMANKRSGMGRQLSLSGSEVLEDGYMRPTRIPSDLLNGRSESNPISSSSSTSDIINSSGENPRTGFRIRQKLVNLRNQYGDKAWMAFVGPYAYRKRQILYRQCFFNPISCF